MSDFASLAARFHRKNVITAAKDCGQPAARIVSGEPEVLFDADLIPIQDARNEAEQKLKEETKGQTLGEWFEREKKKPQPKDKERK